MTEVDSVSTLSSFCHWVRLRSAEANNGLKKESELVLCKEGQCHSSALLSFLAVMDLKKRIQILLTPSPTANTCLAWKDMDQECPGRKVMPR